MTEAARRDVPDGAPHVLVVDDDRRLRELLARFLAEHGYRVSTAASAAEARAKREHLVFDALVLDVMMPGENGFDFARWMRTQSQVPILMLTARDALSDRVAGLDAGADDYLVKPFALEELTARLHALLRRTPSGVCVPLRVGDLLVDPVRRIVRRNGREIELTNREFELLETLARHPGMVLSRSQLLEQVWGYTFEVDSNVVDVYVAYLRRKLEAGGESRLLHTVRGVGFVLRV